MPKQDGTEPNGTGPKDVNRGTLDKCDSAPCKPDREEGLLRRVLRWEEGEPGSDEMSAE